MEAEWYILKQWLPDTNVWVKRLNDNDAVFSYYTEADAEADLPRVAGLYPDREVRIERFAWSA